jgi:hypothetical protein
MLSPVHHRLTKAKLLKLLSELEMTRAKGTSTYLPPGIGDREVEAALGLALDLPAEGPDVVARVEKSPTGAVVFWGDAIRCVILPPFPIPDRVSYSGYEVEPLRALLTRDHVVALVLVRLGLYALGVFEGDQLISSKVGSGLIHSKHSKGGSSQRRFERGREKQMEQFFERICRHARERIEPLLDRLDYLVYGGERSTILAFRKQCKFLRALDDRVVGRLLDIRDPKQASLEAAIGEAWMSDVFEWDEA